MSATAPTRSAVLFLVFNRPDTATQVFACIRQARPPRLYVAADGPRSNKAGEAEKCRATRAIIEQVDWPCQVKTLFRETNLGCKEAVSSAIDWFFGQEEEGIVLEDDCLPAPDFFSYCDTLLERYRADSRIRHIGGCNLQFGRHRGAASYYFSRLTHVWGWASWRRSWQHYDKNLSSYTADDIGDALQNIFDDELIVDRWRYIVAELSANRIDTWDYQLSVTNMLHNGLCIIPNTNLITNIGFGADATHTTESGNRHANIPHGQLREILHPPHFVPNKQADNFTLNEEFKIEETRNRLRKQNNPLRRFRHRLKYWIGSHGGPKRWRKSEYLHGPKTWS
jgi:hypothetical protein